MYTCPTCWDTFLFPTHPCPTCLARQQQQQRRQRARERRASYDPQGQIASEQFWQLLRWYPHCPCCGQRWDQIKSPISQDHIIPISRGGSNTAANLQPLCQSCNLWKSDRLIAFDMQRPGYATALPQRLHAHFVSDPRWVQVQEQDEQQQLTFALLSTVHQVELAYPQATAAQLEAQTLQLTWAAVQAIRSGL